MSPEDYYEPDFVIVPTKAPAEAVTLLLDRFPELREFICSDQYCFSEPTRVYDSFAMEVLKRADDHDFLQSVIQFINELAESNDPLLREVLVICVLEGIASDPDIAQGISGALTQPARALLREVEEKFYGRNSGTSGG
jgi:hypothetical protein